MLFLCKWGEKLAGNIKGITIEIGGNTQKLQNALQDVNKSSRNLQSELKQVEKLLKLDPGNTELLAQKQRLLGESVENTKEKLETLKEAQRQVQERFERGEIGAEQFRALQREVIATEQELERLQDQFTQTARTNNELGLKIGEFGNKANELSGKLAPISATAGAVAVAVGGLSVAVGDDLKRALNDLQSQTGSTDKAMSGLKDSMLNLYKQNMGENFEDLASALAEVEKQTGATGKELEELTYNAILMRDTFGMEVTESIRATDMMIRQFGITGKEAYNLIAQGAQSGLDKNQNLLDTINEYSNTFKMQGFTAEEMFNMLSNGAATGVFDIDKLGDAIKEFGIKSKDGTKGTMEAFKSLGLDADATSKAFAQGGEVGKEAFEKVTQKLFAIKDPLLQNQIGVALFGTMWEDLGVKSMEALTNTQGGINSTKDTLDKINEVKYDSFGQALEGIKRTIETAILIPLGEKLLPFLEGLTENIQKFAENLDGVNPNVLLFGTGLLGLIAFIAPVLAIIGQVATGISALSGFIATFGGASAAAGTSAGALGVGIGSISLPIVAVVATIATFVAALVALYKNNEDFRNNVNQVWTQIKDLISNILKNIGELIKAFVTLATDLWKKYGDDIVNIIKPAFNLVAEIVKTALGIVQNVIKIATSLIKGDWQGVWDGIKGLTGVVWEGIKGIVKNGIDLVKNTCSLGTKIFKDIFSLGWNGVKDLTANIWGGIKTAIENSINGAKDGVGRALDAIKGFFLNLRLPEIKIPPIKLPHFRIKGDFSLNPPRVPSFDVNWYAKGGIFNAPSIIGVGEAGKEAVLPIDRLDDLMASAIQKVGIGNTKSEEININFNSPIYVREEADIKKISREIYKLIEGQRRALGGI